MLVLLFALAATAAAEHQRPKEAAGNLDPLALDAGRRPIV